MIRLFKKSLGIQTRDLRVSPMFSVPLADYTATGERDAILASSGMGKSYLTGVLLEETMENAGMICVIDPEGEHFTLAERYPMMIVGGEHGTLPLVEEAIEVYIEAMLSGGISCIFDLSEFLDDEQQRLYAVIADCLFNAEQRYRRKVRLVVEEAQIYAPQKMSTVGQSKSKKKGPDAVLASQRIAKRGRKRAIDSLWATQRPASISKDILSQCNRFWFGGISSEQDYKAIKSFLNDAGISFQDVRSLQPGEFFFFSKGKTKKIRIRKRLCKHAGATPDADTQFAAVSDKTLDLTMKKMAEQIQAKITEKQQEESEITRLKSIIRSLEKENQKLQKELDTEKLATKVIDRLDMATGAAIADGITGATKPKRSRKKKDEDENRLDPLRVDLPTSRSSSL